MNNVIQFPARPDLEDYRARKESHQLAKWFAFPTITMADPTWKDVAHHSEDQIIVPHNELDRQRRNFEMQHALSLNALRYYAHEIKTLKAQLEAKSIFARIKAWWQQ